MIKKIIVSFLVFIGSSAYALSYETDYLIKSISDRYEVDSKLIYSICHVESKHNPLALNKNDGGSDSIGFCQIKLATARLMGYKGTKKGLLNIKTNLIYATKYLKYQLDRYQGNTRKAILAYNSGTYKKSTTRKGQAVNERYYKKVLLVMKSLTCKLDSSFLISGR